MLKGNSLKLEQTGRALQIAFACKTNATLSSFVKYWKLDGVFHENSYSIPYMNKCIGLLGGALVFSVPFFTCLRQKVRTGQKCWTKLCISRPQSHLFTRRTNLFKSSLIYKMLQIRSTAIWRLLPSTNGFIADFINTRVYTSFSVLNKSRFRGGRRARFLWRT